jgi:ribonuclease HI
MSTKEDAPAINYDKGIVLYSDGGSRPHPGTNGGAGYGGYGIHGYIYSLEPTTKGCGNPNWCVTEKGYVLKKDKTEDTKEVKPVTYIDSFGSFLNPITNNVAELVGASNAINIACNQDIKHFILYTDSKYVVTGANDYLPRWKSRDFIREDGTLITNKNEWLDLEKQLDNLKDKNINYSIEWIKGHNNNLGNDTADKSATIGVFHSKEGILRSETDYYPAQGYWKSEVDKHPLINNKRVYFTTNKETNIPGQYFMGDHGKEDDFLGKRDTEGNYAYVELDTPDPLIELVREKQIKEANGQDIITMLRLDKLFSPQVVSDLNKFGDICLFKPNKYRIDLAFMDAEPMTKGLQPPKLAMRAVEGLNELKGVLVAWRNKDINIVDTQITNYFYEEDKKGLLKIKSDLVSGVDKVKVECFYSIDKKPYNLDLYFGNDLPDRNTIKKIEKLDPKIHLLTWMDSEKAFKYAVVIQVQNAIGIWCNLYSNLKLIKE